MSLPCFSSTAYCVRVQEQLPSYSVIVPPEGASHVEPGYRRPMPIQTTSNSMGSGAPPPIHGGVAMPRQYANLQDPPSPSGKLADRIFRLRHKCIENFGRETFDNAYRYIRSLNEVR